MKKIILLLPIFFLAFSMAKAEKPSDENANIFYGTGESWCEAMYSYPYNNCLFMGSYAHDKLVVKWNNEWNRGDNEDWTNPPYSAWISVHDNGIFPGGSGVNWHYKTVWVGPCGADYTPLSNGGYCIDGQFEVLSSQGIAPFFDFHAWQSHAVPNGYGAY